MKIIVLEHPRMPSESYFNDIAHEPLWSCLMSGYAAAAFGDAGHDVIYLDAPKEGWDFSRTQKEITAWNSQMLCVHGIYLWENTPRLFEMLSQLRADGFKGHICLFGFFPSLAWPVLLQNGSNINSIAVGEPEQTLRDLADTLEVKGDLSRVTGLAFHRPDGPLFTGLRRPEKNPDRFPFPLRHHSPGEAVMILASRGRNNNCPFCPVPSFYGGAPLWRGRNPEKVIEEMRMHKDAGAEDFYFADPDFIGPGGKGRRRVMHMAELMTPLAITFGMAVRPEKLTSDLLNVLKNAGLKSLTLEVDSGLDAMPESMGQPASFAVSEKAVRMCRSAGIEPEISFYMFSPDSDALSLEQHFHFLEKNGLLNRLDRTVSIIGRRRIVLMGTAASRRFQQEGRLVPTGPFGFQGEAAYRCPEVRWMSDVISFACLSVIREMRRCGSPVYQGNKKMSEASRRTNDCLVNLFRSLLEKISGSQSLPALEAAYADIRKLLTEAVYG